jgi:hypothetical protein
MSEPKEPTKREKKERTVGLLKANRSRIAFAVARQIQNLVPKYRELDTVALAHNLETILKGFENLLVKNEGEHLFGAVAMIADVRRVSGFGIHDMTVAGLCFLPVMRRFLIRESVNIEVGLERYESVEAVALPLFGKIVPLFLNIPEDTLSVAVGPKLEELWESMTGEGIEPLPFEIIDVEKGP